MGNTNIKICCATKETRRVHASAFDLMDEDGDEKVNFEEFEMVAKFIHNEHVKNNALALRELSGYDPKEYLYGILGKNKNSRLKRRDFNRLAHTVPLNVWKTKIIPALRDKEINRLKVEQNTTPPETHTFTR